MQYFNVNLTNCTSRSPEMFAPARIPVAAGKNIAKTEKKPSPFLNAGPKFSANIEAKIKRVYVY